MQSSGQIDIQTKAVRRVDSLRDPARQGTSETTAASEAAFKGEQNRGRPSQVTERRLDRRRFQERTDEHGRHTGLPGSECNNWSNVQPRTTQAHPALAGQWPRAFDHELADREYSNGFLCRDLSLFVSRHKRQMERVL
jgi:hypothetical protein